MELIAIIIFGFLTILIGFILTINNILNKKEIQLIDWATSTFSLLYGLGFPVVYIGTMMNKNSNFNSYIIMQYSIVEIIYYYLLVIALILFTRIGWKFKIKKKESLFKTNIRYKATYNSAESLSNYHIKYFKKFQKFSWVMLLISILAYYLYSHAYGGFSGLLSYTIAIRSGYGNLPYNKFSFLEKFGQFSLISMYSFYSIVIDKSIDKKLKSKSVFGFILSFAFSLYVLFSWGGRGGFVFLFLILTIATIYYKRKKVWRFIKDFSGKLVIFPIIFVVIDRLWSRSGRMDLISLAVNSLSYPYIAFIVNFKYSSYRLFIDLLQAPLYFLPSSIWMSILKLNTANAWTTYLVTGGFKGESVAGKIVSGTYPNDLLTFAFMQANILGVIFVAIIFGLLLRFAHNRLTEIRFDGIKYVFYSFCAVRFGILAITGGDIAQVIIGNWGFFVYIIGFSLYRRIKL